MTTPHPVRQNRPSGFVALLRRRGPALVVFALLITQVQAGPMAAQNQAQAPAFADSDATALLNQITSGFVARNARKVLAAFDTAAMPDGDLFRQQLIAFFAQTDTVRIHFNLVKTSTDDGRASAEVEVEMEAAPRDDNATPVHKRDRLTFAAAHTAAGWKFTDVQPRSFFSLQPASGER